MACASSKPIACSFFGNKKTKCGESRGKVDVISLIVNSAISIQNVVKKCSRVLSLFFFFNGTFQEDRHILGYILR